MLEDVLPQTSVMQKSYLNLKDLEESSEDTLEDTLT